MSTTDDSPPRDPPSSSPPSSSSARPAPVRPRGKRGPLPSSCKECRRLKLRCNVRESIPCENCQKRGRGHLCPDGSLSTVPRAARVVDSPPSLSEPETQQLKARIRELEKALRQSHGAVSVEPHPLLRDQEPLLPTSKPSACGDPGDELTESFGTLTIEEDSGRTMWYGMTAASEHFMGVGENNPGLPLPPVDNSIPSELIVLGRMYVLSTPEQFSPSTMRAHLSGCAPLKAEGEDLVKLYNLYGTWLVSPFSREDFNTNVFEPLYATPDWTDVPFDCIAVFYAVLAVGVLYTNVESPKKAGAKYGQIACAALAMARFEDVPTLRCIQALVVLAWQASAAESNLGQNRAWAQIGMAMRLAQSIGLQRDGSHWGLDEKVLQSRRRLFYELHYYDSVMSLWFGRPRAAYPLHFDCQLPHSEDDYDATKLRFVSECLGEVLDKVLAAKSLSYPAILELDKKIRNFMVPMPEVPMTIEPGDFHRIAAGHSLLSLKESSLLYLHRPFFLQAVKQVSSDLFTSRYALSIIAVHQSRKQGSSIQYEAYAFPGACAVIRHVATLFKSFPTISPQVYTHALDAFSASIPLATLVIRAPGLSLSHSAMHELDNVYELFRYAANPTRVRIMLALPIIQRFRALARTQYDAYHLGRTVALPCSAVRELDKLTGGVSVVEKKLTPISGAETFGSNRPTIITGAIQATAATASTAVSPPAVIPLDDVHPALAQEFNALISHEDHFEVDRSGRVHWLPFYGQSNGLGQDSFDIPIGNQYGPGDGGVEEIAVDDWMGTNSTTALLSRDPFDILYGDIWKGVPVQNDVV